MFFDDIGDYVAYRRIFLKRERIVKNKKRKTITDVHCLSRKNNKMVSGEWLIGEWRPLPLGRGIG